MKFSIISSSDAFKHKHRHLETIFQHCNWANINDLMKLFSRTPCNIFTLESNDVVAAMCSVIHYDRFSFLGYMGVHQQFRSQGLAQVLLKNLLTSANISHEKPLLLVSRPEHREFYVNMGFYTQRRILRIRLTPPSSYPDVTKLHYALRRNQIFQVSSFDERIFGSDRSQRIAATLADPASQLYYSTDANEQVEGYVIYENRRHGLHVGPIVSSASQIPQIIGASYAVLSSKPKFIFCDIYEDSLSSAELIDLWDVRVEKTFSLMSSTRKCPSHAHGNSRVHALWGRASG